MPVECRRGRQGARHPRGGRARRRRARGDQHPNPRRRPRRGGRRPRRPGQRARARRQGRVRLGPHRQGFPPARRRRGAAPHPCRRRGHAARSGDGARHQRQHGRRHRRRPRTSARTFIGALRERDALTVLGFNDNIFTVARRETQAEARLKALDRLAPWGATSLYDVISRGVTLLRQQPGRKGLVVFSDGEDESSRLTFDTVEQELQSSDAVMYAVGLGRGARMADLTRQLSRLSDASGGRTVIAPDTSELSGAFGDVVAELSHQYVLSYAPTNDKRDGTWRTLTVEVPGRDVRLRARQGYRARRHTRRGAVVEVRVAPRRARRRLTRRDDGEYRQYSTESNARRSRSSMQRASPRLLDDAPPSGSASRSRRPDRGARPGPGARAGARGRGRVGAIGPRARTGRQGVHGDGQRVSPARWLRPRRRCSAGAGRTVYVAIDEGSVFRGAEASLRTVAAGHRRSAGARAIAWAWCCCRSRRPRCRRPTTRPRSRSALAGMTGRRPNDFGNFSMGVGEALAIAESDTFALTAVADKECRCARGGAGHLHRGGTGRPGRRRRLAEGVRADHRQERRGDDRPGPRRRQSRPTARSSI